ncbi:LysR family transcriptional regulator [Parathalassolituus penaei]|uniref:LysR family transcriptional regulator n=1 Tax=Parathalassolituus penaei TaxID=2997323 RepID=A0A9X3ITD9_9GAMM|nr:LysR family transcriptional regulator [Parathalassolituus penaei]MCY0965093.1 LysR family transcriptional regulator [Parathalassolituus penaei]
MDTLDGLKAFVATAQTGSFTAAAEQLGISNRLVSKYVAELEQRTGARLLQRTTRQVGLSAAGEALYERVPALLEELDELLGAVSADARQMAGRLRISAPVMFGEVYLQGLIQRFASQYPQLVLDLQLSDDFVDLVQEGIDLAFRIGDPKLDSLKARKLGEIRTLLVAAPSYLANAPALSHPEELLNHRCIIDTNRETPWRWLFSENEQPLVVSVPQTLLVNSARVARDWAMAGYGIARVPDFAVRDAIAREELVVLLEGFHHDSHPVNAVYLAGTSVPRKVRALIDFAVVDSQRLFNPHEPG